MTLKSYPCIIRKGSHCNKTYTIKIDGWSYDGYCYFEHLFNFDGTPILVEIQEDLPGLVSVLPLKSKDGMTVCSMPSTPESSSDNLEILTEGLMFHPTDPLFHVAKQKQMLELSIQKTRESLSQQEAVLKDLTKILG
jgi:hypothetical protein